MNREEPRHNNRSDGGYRTQERAGSSFGEHGAALLGELRRMPAALDRQFDGEQCVSAASRNDGEEDVVNFVLRGRLANPDHRQGRQNGALRAWLERLEIDDAHGTHPGRADGKDRLATTEPGPSILRFDANLVRRPASRNAERARKESISNIHDLQITGPPSRQRSAEPTQPCPPDAPAALRQEAPPGETQASEAPTARAVRTGLAYLLASCGQLVGYFRVPQQADTEGADLTRSLGRGFQDELRTGVRVLVLGLGLAGGWAVFVPLSAAVTIPGTLVLESSVKKIQYPAGGVIAEIRAHDGMRVNKGDLLVRLDETQLRANMQVIADQLDETRVRIARLTAERDGLEAPKMSGQAAAQPGGQEVTRLLASETSLFKARLGTRESQKQLLRSNITQLEEEIDGIDAQIKSKSAQLDLISSELKGVQTLFAKQLVPLTRLTALQREAAQLDGERSQLKSTISETRSKISQAELQIIKIDQDLRSDVMKDLRESQDKESELTQKIVAARDQLNRVEIRAPSAGVVHQLMVHTIGGVVGAGEIIMEIVPDSDDLQIEARLPPIDIDHVHVGQDVLVRFSAFNQRTTPQVHGFVSYVSADLVQDPQNKSASYYTIWVKPTGDELRRLGNLQLVSGMPAELFLRTGSRTMMSYLLKPITDQLKRTFSEP
jgi:HlyD family secretion protein